MSKSSKLFDKAKALIPGGVNSPVRSFKSVKKTPFFTKSANGPFLFTADNQKLIDFVCTWGPAIHGHNDKDIKEAIENSLKKGTSFGTPHENEIKIAELIKGSVTSIEKVRLMNSGTEATMTAIRLARGYTKRKKIIKFAGGYHGHVDSLLVEAGSGAINFNSPTSEGIPNSFIQETIILQFNDKDSLNKVFKKYGEEIACVIVEPYMANCGLILPVSGFLRELRSITEKYRSILIFDEIMTGFRIGLGGVQAEEKILPDLTALGKIIGGGLPVGALGGKSEIMDFLAPNGPVYQAGTLSGNPLAVAAGIASIKKLKKTKPYKKLSFMVSEIKKAITNASKEKSIPIVFNNAGSMFSIFFTNKEINNFLDAKNSNTNLFNSFFSRALKNGLYVPPSKFETFFISTSHQQVLDESIAKLSDSLRKI